MALPKICDVAKLWAEPELRFTPGGKAVLTLPLVFGKRKKNANGEWEDAGSLFVRGTAWDDLAEHAAESFAKGDMVIVQGELYQREYEKDGEKRQSLEMTVYAVGPDVKRASVSVNRVERTKEATPFDDPWGGTTTQEAPF